MTESISMQISGFLSVYILLLIVVFIFKRCGIRENKLLIMSALQMTVQLIIAGYVLLYIFKTQSPLFTIVYLGLMIGYAIYRTLRKNPWLNPQFRWITVLSIGLTGAFVVTFVMVAVIRKSLLSPQYIIPISGMLVAATMNGATLALKSFHEALDREQRRLEVLLNVGASPREILLPFVNQSLETSLLPTVNNMVGMGIVSLPGMMTGQILAGALPNEAVLYQITIMIANSTVVCLASFCLLYFGSRTLWNKRYQFTYKR